MDNKSVQNSEPLRATCENELAQLEMSKFKVNSWINKHKAQYLKQSINPKDHENQLLYYVNDEFQIKVSFNVRTKKGKKLIVLLVLKSLQVLI